MAGWFLVKATSPTKTPTIKNELSWSKDAPKCVHKDLVTLSTAGLYAKMLSKESLNSEIVFVMESTLSVANLSLSIVDCGSVVFESGLDEDIGARKHEVNNYLKFLPQFSHNYFGVVPYRTTRWQQLTQPTWTDSVK